MTKFINYKCKNASNNINYCSTWKTLRVRVTKYHSYDVQMIPWGLMHSFMGQVLTSIILQLRTVGSKSALANLLRRSTNIISIPLHLFFNIISSTNVSEYSLHPILPWYEQVKSHCYFLCSVASSAVPKKSGENDYLMLNNHLVIWQ